MDSRDCNDVHQYNKLNEQCAFVRNNSDCLQAQGMLNYIDFVFCTFEFNYFAVCISCLWLLLLFIVVGRTADDFFCPALDVIAKFFKLSHNVAGVTFLAFGNGASDIFSSIAGITQMRPELVVGSLFGAGIFVTTVVAGSIILVSPFDMMQRPFLRDVIFYLFSVFWTFILFYKGKVTLFNSAGFILLYIIYLIVVLVGHYIYKKWLKPISIPNLVNKNSTIVITVATPDGSVISQEGDEDRDHYFWRRRSIERRRSSTMSRSLSECSINSVTSSSPPSKAVSPKVSFISEIPLKLEIPKLTDDVNEATPLLNGCGAINFIPDHYTESKRFIRTTSPIDLDLWPDMATWQKFLRIIAFPLVLLLTLTIPVVDHDKPINNWCRSLIIVNIILSPLIFCFALGYGQFCIYGIFPLPVLLLVISAVLSIIILITSSNDHPPVYHSLFSFVGFGASVLWIYFLSNEIVSLLKMVGVVMHLSDSMLGLTILAWGNSLPDLVADVGLAKQDLPRMGMSGCFGGPLFNLLIGIGIPFTILTINTESRMMILHYFKSTTILTIFLMLSLLSSLIIIPLMGFHTHKSYGYYLIALYLLFFIFAVLNELRLF